MNSYSVSLLCFAFGVLIVSFFTLAKRGDAIGRRFFLFSIAVSGWGALSAFWVSQNYSENRTLLLVRVAHTFAVFVPITWVHFVFKFIGKKEPRKNFYFRNYLVASILSLIAPTPFLISHMHPILGFKYYTGAGPLYFCFVLVYIYLVPYGAYELYKAYRKSEFQRKESLRNLLLGTVIGFSGAASSMFGIYHVPVPIYIYYLMPLYPILTGIALIKHGLFDTQQIADAFQREKITALGILAASLNHEMRNPLYIAKGRIEGYRAIVENKGAASGEKTEEVIRSVSTQLDRTLDIMQRFSDFAKPINTHKDKELFVLGDLIQNVLELVSYALVSQKIEVKVAIEPGLQLRCSRRQLEEVLVNLMTNACQAIKSGTGSGMIELRAHKQKNGIHIEVSDNGPGMDTDQSSRIFDPFYTTKEKGTGLGLYITKQLVEKNGGKITVKSIASHGTSFLIHIPSVEPVGGKTLK